MPFELTPHHFLYVQLAILVLGVSFLLWRPKSRKGFVLKLGKSNFTSKTKAQIESARRAMSNPIGASGDGGRDLQVFFNYNGHTFEAYEVLGLPAGTATEKIEAAIRAQLQVSDKESRPFLEAAFHALKTSRN